MNIEINGKSADLSFVTANHGLNYNQFKSAELETHTYEFIVEKQEFITLIEDEYVNARDEIKADDAACNETSDFTASGYASLNDMFNYKDDLAEVVSTYLDRAIFERTLPLEIEQGFVINSTDRVTVGDNSITIIGRAYRWPVNKSKHAVSVNAAGV